MLNYKVEKLNKTLGISRYPSRLIRGNYVELDIKKALLEQGYDITKPALFVWEGNSMYFTPEKTKEILAMVLREFPKSEIAFDCLTKEVSGGEPVTAETEWFWGMSYLFTSQAGVSQQWEGPCDTAQYARDVPFEVCANPPKSNARARNVLGTNSLETAVPCLCSDEALAPSRSSAVPCENATFRATLNNYEGGEIATGGHH